MKILLVSTPVEAIGQGIGGGVDVTLHNLIEALFLRGHEISVCAPTNSRLQAGTPAELIEIGGELQTSCQTQPVSAPIELPLDGVLPNMWQHVQAIQSRFDYIINLAYDWLPIWLTQFFSTPVLHLISMSNENQSVAMAVEALDREDPSRLAFHTAQSASTFDLEKPVTIVANGFNLEQFPSPQTPAPFLAWVGRISPEKGLEDAVAIAAKAGLPLHVWGCEQSHDYKEQIENAAPPDSVIWHGFVEHETMLEEISHATALLMTPKWIEGFGNCVAESLCCGVPVIAYARGGPTEIVEDGVTGFLVPPDNIDEAAAAVHAIDLIDRETCRERAQERFSLDAYADRIEQWLASAATQPSASPGRLM